MVLPHQLLKTRPGLLCQVCGVQFVCACLYVCGFDSLITPSLGPSMENKELMMRDLLGDCRLKYSVFIAQKWGD